MERTQVCSSVGAKDEVPLWRRKRVVWGDEAMNLRRVRTGRGLDLGAAPLKLVAIRLLERHQDLLLQGAVELSSHLPLQVSRVGGASIERLHQEAPEERAYTENREP